MASSSPRLAWRTRERLLGRSRCGKVMRGRPRVRAILVERTDDAAAVVERVDETGSSRRSVDGRVGAHGFDVPFPAHAREDDQTESRRKLGHSYRRLRGHDTNLVVGP